jgi:hypothetical protein
MTSPLLSAKDHASPSVFQPGALLREARRRLLLSITSSGRSRRRCR